MMRTALLGKLVAVLAIAAVARAQQTGAPAEASAADTISVRVQLVSVNALVRDKKGELVHGLTKEDFVLREDGKPQTIRYFNTDSDLPLMLGLMVDTSGSMTTHIADEQAASATFLEEMLARPQDRAFLVRFDSNVLLLQGTTSDVWQLKSALWMLADPDARPTDFRARRRDPAAGTPANSGPGSGQNPGQAQPPDRGAVRHGGTLLFDGVAAATAKVIGKEPGRRALVVLTDGDDNGSRTSLEETIRAAQNADVAVYAVLYLRDDGGGDFGRDWGRGGGRGGPGMGGGSGMSGKEVMERMARQTGGRCFVVDKQMPIARIFATIEQDMRNQYRLGFTPLPEAPPKPAPAPAPSGRKGKKGAPVVSAAPATDAPANAAGAVPVPRYHTLEVKTRDGHLSVQARAGYYSPQLPMPGTPSPPENKPPPPNTSTNP